MVAHTAQSSRLRDRQIAIFVSYGDSLLAANQLRALQKYADAMGWVDALVERVATHGVELLAVAQSCTVLQE